MCVVLVVCFLCEFVLCFIGCLWLCLGFWFGFLLLIFSRFRMILLVIGVVFVRCMIICWFRWIICLVFDLMSVLFFLLKLKYLWFSLCMGIKLLVLDLLSCIKMLNLVMFVILLVNLLFNCLFR